MRLGGSTRLSSLKRVNEPPNVDCKVCQDDSGFIAEVSVKSLGQTKLRELTDHILPKGLKVKTESLLIEFGGKLIYEREADLSEDESEVYERRLDKSLADLQIKHFSILYVQAVLETR